MGANPEAICATGTGCTGHTALATNLWPSLTRSFSLFSLCKYDSRPSPVGWNLAQSLRRITTRRTLESCTPLDWLRRRCASLPLFLAFPRDHRFSLAVHVSFTTVLWRNPTERIIWMGHGKPEMRSHKGTRTLHLGFLAQPWPHSTWTDPSKPPPDRDNDQLSRGK